MSAAGCCYVNAGMEFFWSILKTELVPENCFADLREARTTLFEYIKLFYNPQQLHSALGCQSPVDFENQTTINKISLPIVHFVGITSFKTCENHPRWQKTEKTPELGGLPDPCFFVFHIN